MNVAIAEVGPDGNLDRCVKCRLLPAVQRPGPCVTYFDVCKKFGSRGNHDFDKPGRFTSFVSDGGC